MDQLALYQALFKLQESNPSASLLFPNIINLQEQLSQLRSGLSSTHYTDDIPFGFINDNSKYQQQLQYEYMQNSINKKNNSDEISSANVLGKRPNPLEYDEDMVEKHFKKEIVDSKNFGQLNNHSVSSTSDPTFFALQPYETISSAGSDDLNKSRDYKALKKSNGLRDVNENSNFTRRLGVSSEQQHINQTKAAVFENLKRNYNGNIGEEEISYLQHQFVNPEEPIESQQAYQNFIDHNRLNLNLMSSSDFQRNPQIPPVSPLLANEDIYNVMQTSQLLRMVEDYQLRQQLHIIRNFQNQIQQQPQLAHYYMSIQSQSQQKQHDNLLQKNYMQLLGNNYPFCGPNMNKSQLSGTSGSQVNTQFNTELNNQILNKLGNSGLSQLNSQASAQLNNSLAAQLNGALTNYSTILSNQFAIPSFSVNNTSPNQVNSKIMNMPNFSQFRNPIERLNQSQIIETPINTTQQPILSNFKPIQKSQILDKITNDNLDKRTSDNFDKRTSDNLDKRTSDNLDKRTNDNLDKRTNDNLDKKSLQNVESLKIMEEVKPAQIDIVEIDYNLLTPIKKDRTAKQDREIEMSNISKIAIRGTRSSNSNTFRLRKSSAIGHIILENNENSEDEISDGEADDDSEYNSSSDQNSGSLMSRSKFMNKQKKNRASELMELYEKRKQKTKESQKTRIQTVRQDKEQKKSKIKNLKQTRSSLLNFDKFNINNVDDKMIHVTNILNQTSSDRIKIDEISSNLSENKLKEEDIKNETEIVKIQVKSEVLLENNSEEYPDILLAKKIEIKMGVEHQASIPPYKLNRLPLEDKREPNLYKEIWKPDVINREQFEVYLRQLRESMGSNYMGEEKAGMLLKEQNYNYDKALDLLKNDKAFFRRFKIKRLQDVTIKKI